MLLHETHWPVPRIDIDHAWRELENCRPFDIKISCDAARTSCKTFISPLSAGIRRPFYSYPHFLWITLWTKPVFFELHSAVSRFSDRLPAKREKIILEKSMAYPIVTKTRGDAPLLQRSRKKCE
jgi:hypothetical protein